MNAYPLTPAGTRITYLTSTNRNAYQEGDDAKEAGYVLGRIVKVTLGMSNTNDGTGVDWRYSDSVVVNSDGVVSLGGNPTQLILASWDTQDVCDVLKGKFACPVTTGSRFSTNEVVFFPNDTVFSKSSVSGGYVAINAEQYQIVTGSPAIPAGTTIEYLGVLGDKIRMQIVSYIGTGTSGEATPCSITADFKFKTAEYLGSLRGGSLSPAVTYIDARDKVLSEAITTEFTAYSGFCLDDSQDSFGKKSEDGKTITWYSRYNNRQSNQLNEAGVKYYFRFFG